MMKTIKQINCMNNQRQITCELSCKKARKKRHGESYLKIVGEEVNYDLGLLLIKLVKWRN